MARGRAQERGRIERVKNFGAPTKFVDQRRDSAAAKRMQKALRADKEFSRIPNRSRCRSITLTPSRPV